MTARDMVRDLREAGRLPARSPSSGWIATVLALVLALGAGAALVYLGTTFVLPALNRAPPPAPAPAKIVAAAHTGLNFESAEPFGPADQAACQRLAYDAQARFEAALKDNGGDWNSFASNAGTRKIAALGAGLACEAKTRPLRLCDPAERAKFVERTRSYFDTVALMKTMLGFAAASPGLALAGPGNLVSEMIDNGGKQVQALHQNVIDAFRGLAQKGLLSESDYGLFGAPEELKPAFANLTVTEAACA